MHRSVPWRVVLLLAALALTLPMRVVAQEGGSTAALATPGPSGNRVDIGGRALFISCTGTGSPTVVLEAGSGSASNTWFSVQPEVARFTRVCSYDRAGLGRSDPAPSRVRTV
jgi:pimeloyl-ACP methyl ester carboxylesterase